MSALAESLLKCKVEGNVLYLPPMSDGPLENYQDVRKALLNAGAKYKRNSFVFPSDAQPYIDRLTGGENVNLKKEFQFFETPVGVADWLVELAELGPYDEILEPSAGQGAIVKAIQRATHEGRVVYGYELMDINKSVLKTIPGFNLLGSDFFECALKYDKIIANPPFSKNQDIDHINHMYDRLRSGGRLVSVASKHWQISNNKKEIEFSEWINEVNADVYELDQGTFKESGTLVSSVIVVIDKP